MEDVVMEPVEEIVEPQGEVAEIPSADSGHAADHSEELTPAAPVLPAETKVFENGKLSDTAKAHLDQLKATDPALEKQLRMALYQSEALARVAPGGVREITALKKDLDSLGGLEVVKERVGELGYFNDLDSKFTAADPAFVAELIATPEGQQAFLQLAPTMLQKFALLNPAGHGAYVAQTIQYDMLANEIPFHVKMLGSFISQHDDPRIKEAFQGIAAYFDRIKNIAKGPLTPEKAAAPAVDDREAQLNQREEGLTRDEWTGQADAYGKEIFNREFARLSAGRTVSDTQKAAIIELYQARALAAIQKDTKLRENSQAYFKTRDREGYLKLVKSTYDQKLATVLRSAFDTILPGKPGPKNAPPKPAPANGAPKPAQEPTAFKLITTGAPKIEQIDRARTSKDMISEGKAVLLDGSRIRWR